MIDLTPILEALLGLLAAIITVKVIPWIKAKTTNEQQIKIEAAVRTAVFAAEQIYGAGHGKEKLDYAAEYLHNHGYEVDLDQIEAAVQTYFHHIDILIPTEEAEEEPGEAEEAPTEA